MLPKPILHKLLLIFVLISLSGCGGWLFLPVLVDPSQEETHEQD